MSTEGGGPARASSLRGNARGIRYQSMRQSAESTAMILIETLATRCRAREFLFKNTWVRRIMDIRVLLASHGSFVNRCEGVGFGESIL